MEGLHLNVLCFFIEMCFWKASIPMRFYVDFSLSLVFICNCNQSSWNKPSFSFFLKSLVSLFSGLGKGGFTIRCCTKWRWGLHFTYHVRCLEKPVSLRWCAWSPALHTPRVISRICNTNKILVEEWGEGVHKCIHHKRAHHLVQTVPWVLQRSSGGC